MFVRHSPVPDQHDRVGRIGPGTVRRPYTRERERERETGLHKKQKTE